jgi:hypothetical protein
VAFAVAAAFALAAIVFAARIRDADAAHTIPVRASRRAVPQAREAASLAD